MLSNKYNYAGKEPQSRWKPQILPKPGGVLADHLDPHYQRKLQETDWKQVYGRPDNAPSPQPLTPAPEAMAALGENYRRILSGATDQNQRMTIARTILDANADYFHLLPQDVQQLVRSSLAGATTPARQGSRDPEYDKWLGSQVENFRNRGAYEYFKSTPDGMVFDPELARSKEYGNWVQQKKVLDAHARKKAKELRDVQIAEDKKRLAEQQSRYAALLARTQQSQPPTWG